jgi:hypothetical protein
MNEEVELEVRLTSEWHNDPPAFTIMIDNECIETGTVLEKESEKGFKSIKWKGELGPGEHTLTVSYRGKNIGKRHTILDEAGNIVKDQILSIDAVFIDNIDLGHLAIKLGKYYTNNSDGGNHPPLFEGKRSFGMNGNWKLNFTVPTYMWLLENL